MRKAICMRNSNFGLDESSNLLELYSSGFLQGLERKRQTFSASLAGITPDSFYKSKLTQRCACHTLTQFISGFIVACLISGCGFFPPNKHLIPLLHRENWANKSNQRWKTSLLFISDKYFQFWDEWNFSNIQNLIWPDQISEGLIWMCLCVLVYMCVCLYTHRDLKSWRISVARV